MTVIQMLPTLAYGDAVGNNTIALKDCLIKMGIKTEIYAQHIDDRLPKGTAKDIRKLPHLNKDAIVIYHMSTGSEWNLKFGQLHCKKVMIYHNITPPEMLAPYNEDAARDCREGLEELKILADKVDYCIADSEFNKQELIKAGYKCKIDVLPILIAFDDYKKKPSENIINQYKDDGYVNVLFTGRVASNKCQEDVIRSFASYQKNFNPKSRLFLVGNVGGYEAYKKRLQKYAKLLDAKNVIFTGHIKFNDILAYYNIADVFVCQSEHEGFCVPLVEAMYFNVPVIAYDSSAIAETLGTGGFILKDKNSVETAGAIHRVICDNELRQKLIHNQKERLKDFNYNKIYTRFQELMKENVL